MLECLVDYVYQTVFKIEFYLLWYIVCVLVNRVASFPGHTSLPSCHGDQVRRRRHRARVSCCGFLIDYLIMPAEMVMSNGNFLDKVLYGSVPRANPSKSLLCGYKSLAFNLNLVKLMS